MITKAQKIRLGIFIAIGSFLILLFAGVVAGSGLSRKEIFITFNMKMSLSMVCRWVEAYPIMASKWDGLIISN